MALRKGLLIVTCMAVSVAGIQFNPDSSCDFTGIDVDDAIARMLAKLPGHQLRIGGFKGTFAGIEFLHLNMSGLNKLRRFGAAVPYCINGTRMIRVELVCDDDAALTVPWKFCTGTEGSIEMRPKLVRFTTLFSVNVPDITQDVKLAYEGPTIPVTTENLKLSVNGAGSFSLILSTYFSMAFPAVIREIWNENFFFIFVGRLKRL
uniref:Putative secreted protein n=1 Tax=Amblyomma triste TaxID=251400 RepID=A0A023GAU8_AMBTT